MKIYKLLPIASFASTPLFTHAHVMMKDPPPRRSKYSPYYVKSGLVDYNLLSPINAGYSFPCKGFPPGPSTKTIGQNVQITLEGSATHGGGHCQFGISYDNVNFVVLKTVIRNCLLSSMSYSFDLPPNAPNTKTIVFWTWINAIGNREYYMDCADVNVVTNSAETTASIISGHQLFVSNLPGFPTIPEFPRSDMYDGSEYIVSQPTFSIKAPSSDAGSLVPHTINTPLLPPPPPSPVSSPSSPLHHDDHLQTTPSPQPPKPQKHDENHGTVPPTPPPSPVSNCNDGEMKCGVNNGFDTCVFDKWIWRACAPGTACKKLTSGSVLCDFA